MKVLFIGRTNGGMSAMAECLAKKKFDAEIKVESAGLEAGSLDPLAVEALKEAGVDLGAHQPRPLAAVDLSTVDLVVVVGERDAMPKDLPNGGPKKLHWPMPDPRQPPASRDELLKRFRDVRLALEKHIMQIGKIKRQISA